MVEEEKFQNTLDRLADYVEGIGDELQEVAVDDIFTATIRKEDYQLTGHQCRAEEDSFYAVAGHPDLRFFHVVYALSLKRNIGLRLDDEIINALLDEETKDENRRGVLAGEKLLNQLPEGDMEALKTYTFMFVSSAENTTILHSDDNGVLDVYTVGNLVFPYEEEFAIRHFQKAVQATVSSGRRGSELLRRTVFIDVDKDNPSETQLELNFGW